MEQRVFTLCAEWLRHQVRLCAPSVVLDSRTTSLKCYYFLNGNAEKFPVIREEGREYIERLSTPCIFTHRGAEIIRDILDDAIINKRPLLDEMNTLSLDWSNPFESPIFLAHLSA